MVEDVVRTLGFLCLGSRLRRIGERLQADTQQVIDEAGLSIQAGKYPFLAAIDLSGPLTIGELAQAVGITQPGATRTIGQLLE
ncbi:MarR family transcriptional regulator, partial [Streptomyces clavuligerus]|uniref:MarR family transcriptional regulator n=1 Tax=Streptomyces clavuligerus TaxID=1901 RepID=UPI0018D0E7F5